ncbi:MAG: acetamidase/formamidase family protein, partial [Myxococcota bacterium]|nr:acetamidase/formamidase family protein [Myxococcota bacterium]
VLDIPESNWFLAEQERPLHQGGLRPWDARSPEDEGHCLVGPFYVEEARPGMTLEVRVLEVVPGSWGWSGVESNDSPWGRRLLLPDDTWLGLLWEIDVDAGTATNHLGDRVRTRPFPGVIGMPPNQPGRHSTVPPRYCGGNLDCRELIAGSRLFLPVPVEGGLVSFGDGHALQGDGEVSGVAVECPLRRLEVELHLHPNMALTAPRAETPAGKIAFGIHKDMNEAWALALDNMVCWIMEIHGISRARAVALASLCVDLRITQVVNQVCGVHAVLREEDLTIGQASDHLTDSAVS